MPQTSKDEEALFRAAVELPPDKCPAFLEAMCDGDGALRTRLEERLASRQPSQTSPSKQADPGRTIKIQPQPEDESIGKTIGHYKLLQKIGEGGCGAVYMAEQEYPVRRRVAVKVIKLGMDTKTVIARFEAERQALALMDHPNIAKVLDAGATDTGRPYFVMELVRGVKITEYCDQNKLDTRKRLELFIQICQAIQHAHQKGIIHRDIKPSNILVTLHDGVPVPKVIDFGIAKATTDQRLTDKTLFTAYEQFIGTPAYMSPEQAEMSGLDIDTRSDIYSLGVLLYELLTGRTPFDPKELMKSGLEAMRKMIREEEPVRPSTKVATLQSDELTTTAERHAAEAPRLVSNLRGDLDWIVMKCLEKDRTRRYETANGLAMDIKRHLANETIVARPPSSSYRFQKLVRRHKVAVAAGVAVAFALLLGMIVATWQAIRAKRAEGLALQSRSESEKLSNFILDVFYTVLEPSGQYDTVARLARQAVAYYEGLPESMRTPDTARNRAMAQARLALVTGQQGNGKAALPLAQEAVAALDQMRKQGDQSEETIFALGLAQRARYFAYRATGDFASITGPLQHGTEVLRPFALSPDGSRRIKLEYANLLNFLSHDQASEQSIGTCEEALRVLAGLGALDLSDLAAASAWADVADSEAREAMSIGGVDDAERLEKQVQTLAEGVVAQRPGDLRARLDLFFAPDVLALVEARRFHDEAALRLANQALQAAQEYIRFNPSDSEGWIIQNEAYYSTCALLLRQGRISEALAQAIAAMKIDIDPRNKIGNLTGSLGQFAARWEAQRGNRAAAEQYLQDSKRSSVASASRQNMSEPAKNYAAEVFILADCSVRLAFGEDAAVCDMASNSTTRLDRYSKQVNINSIKATLLFFERQSLTAAVLADLHLGRYADAETDARQALAVPSDLRASSRSDRSTLDHPYDSFWVKVLLAQTEVGQGRNAEALKTIEPALAQYRDDAAKGASYITFRQHFARALYVQALAEPSEPAGAALARESLDQALRVLDGLSEEAKQLHDSKELVSWITVAKKKLN